MSPGKNLGVSGAVGPVASLEKKSAAAVEPQVGLGATTAWKLNAISASTSVALFFRPTAKDKSKAPAAGTPLHFQVRFLQLLFRTNTQNLLFPKPSLVVQPDV